MAAIDSVRPEIREMSGYVPGEQPRGAMRIIKLNTNENPYPPPEPVLRSLRDAVGQHLRLYPEPTALHVRRAAARVYHLDEDQVLVGNGSDDLLTIILRTFVGLGEGVATPDPTYSLYEPLTRIQGGTFHYIPWAGEGRLPIDALVATGAKVIFVVRPNAPTGHAVGLDEVRELASRAPGVVVLDEAYGDFCADNGLSLLAECDNLIVTRSFSKSFSLAGIRLGLLFTSIELAHEMHKVRDSYNVDALAQAAGVAALDNVHQFRLSTELVIRERERITEDLRKRGFHVPASHANFVLATIPAGRRSGTEWLADLKARGFLVRYWNKPGLDDKLRITVGTQDDMQSFLEAVDALLADN